MTDKEQELLLDATGKCEQCGVRAPLLGGLCEVCSNDLPNEVVNLLTERD